MNSDKFEIVYSYTRAQAVADGFQIEVTKTAAEAGIRFPVFLTRTVFDSYVTARCMVPSTAPAPMVNGQPQNMPGFVCTNTTKASLALVWC